jgi:DNA-binding GntR family transcriptional regulator
MPEKTRDSNSAPAPKQSRTRTTNVQARGRERPARTALKRGVPLAPDGAADAPRANLAQSVYEQVKSDIFEFRLIPGARFSENEIASRTGVSRTPVREALYRLAQERFLEVHAKSGWSVGALDFERFDQLYDVRVILELAALRKICEGMLNSDLSALRQTWLVAARARLKDGKAVAALDEQFHATLVVAAGNAELARIYTDISERIRIVRRLDFTQPERIDRTYEEHAEILRAVLTRKTEQASMLLKAHIEASKLEVRKISLHRLHMAQRESTRQS